MHWGSIVMLYEKAIAAILLLLSAFFSGWWFGSDHIKSKWNAEKVTIAQAADKAIIERVTQNQRLIDKNAADNAAITKAKNEEIASVRTALAVSLRRGTGICARPAAAPQASPTGGSNAASASGELFRDDIQRDIGAALMEMEEVASTARACQAWARSTQ